VAVQTGLRFTQIETGGNFTCALSTAGNAHCWGRGALGRLGTGDVTNRTVPWPVVGGRTFARITANDEHACGLELDGTAWCWGKNASGQLGDGTTTNRVAPVAVIGVPKLASIAAGGGLIQANTTGFTCGLTANGTLWCWGFNRSGQLMTATTGGAQVTPVQALTTLRFRSLSTFVSGVCAQGLDDETYCWGDGTFGDGTETFTPFLRPKRMFY
jgi:alpha-tubulin suppressor-like RCC1 family protein